MTDYYRDRVRHGGILANNFVKFWWENQVGPMQYGTEEKRPRRFGQSFLLIMLGTWNPLWLIFRTPFSSVIICDAIGPGVMGPPVGPECLEGSVPLSTRLALRRDQTIDNKENRYLDDPYHASRVYDLGAIEVPLLSVANLGGILLHLRGNVVGYMEAGTKNKWLHFISGR
jgi:hypothetical protein